MTRTKVLLVVCFLAAFAAGGAAGLVARKDVDHPPRGRSMLREQLNLTAEQQEQMHKIWSGVDASARQHFDQRRAFAEERDKAIADLLTPEQKPKYDQIRQDYDRKLAELSQERKLAYDQAVEKTKLILIGDQVTKYEELLKRQRERGPGGPRGRFGGAPQGEGGPGPLAGPRSRPAQNIESNTPRVGE